MLVFVVACSDAELHRQVRLHLTFRKRWPCWNKTK